MNNPWRIAAMIIVPLLGFAALLWWLAQGVDVSILNPHGLIAVQEKQLIITVVLLMLIVVIPVYILTFVMAWRYRAGAGSTYTPDHDHDIRIEMVWWAIPIAIIGMLAVTTWQTTHSLDPFNPIASSVKPLQVQVIALNWKWLFIYPEQGIASVNDLTIPVGVPIDFDITSDAPMNSFWIPSLGSQIYAMPGMSSELHLIADDAGEYRGMSANFSGQGFSGMHFPVHAVSHEQFEQWMQSVKDVPDALDQYAYDALAMPSSDNPPAFYSSIDTGLYNTVVLKYLSPQATHQY